MRCLQDGKPYMREDVQRKIRKRVILVTDPCLSLMRYNSPIDIDATFRSVPPSFSQCAIV
ncbi:hypothetical protein HZS_5910 [Henneguya salminicola]|nr:hypothetical protein HZS_5910 [Henneguya salminicola]